MTTKTEQRHLDRVAQLGCILCFELGYGWADAEIHHLREGQGGAQRAPNWLVVPLCPECHRGPHGVHGDRMRLKQAKIYDEIGLLALTLEALLS